MTTEQSNIAETLAAEFQRLYGSKVHDLPTFPLAPSLTLLELPEGRRTEYLTERLDALLPRPRALVQRVTMTDLGALVAYITRYKTAGATCFLFRDDPCVTAILDYHEAPETPAWGRHVVEFWLRHTDEWKAWSRVQGLDQRNFAEFIEDRVTDLAVAAGDSSVGQLAATLGLRLGSPGDVIRASRGLSLSVEAQVRDSAVLTDGTVQVQYVETAKASSAEVPGLFAVQVPVFEGLGGSYLLGVRVRYRVEAGRVKWTLVPHQPRRIEDAALAEVATFIREVAEVPVYLGGVVDK